jgi:hypothetical protein
LFYHPGYGNTELSILKEKAMLGCQIQLGCGGDFMVQFGQELVYGSSLADVKGKVQARWNKSIGKSYKIFFVDSNGDEVIETFVPKLVKVRSETRKVCGFNGQLELGF